MSLRKLVGFIHPRVAVVIHDLAMTALAWWIAKMLRYTFNPGDIVSFQMLEFPIVLVIQGLILRWTGLYRSVWRFASLPDLWNIARASLIGTVSIGLALFLYDRLGGVPRTTFLLYPLLLGALLGLPRLAYRFWKDSRRELLNNHEVKRVLIVGADRATAATRWWVLSTTSRACAAPASTGTPYSAASISSPRWCAKRRCKCC
jgi:FlaA1/EpsC-like NDP-sugar epimerase